MDDLDYENAKRSIPDSYDLCSCASGSKYKFCCKRIFGEIVNAMVAAEEGEFEEALKWIASFQSFPPEITFPLYSQMYIF